MANLKMKTGASTRSLAALETQSDDTKEPTTREELQRKIKSMRADLKKAKQGKHKAEQDLSRAKKKMKTGGGGGNRSNKFDPQNPTQQLTHKAYSKLTDAAGIPTRKVSAVSTVRFAEGDKLEEGPTVPTAGVSPALLKPCIKKVSLTQRSATYSKKKADE